MTDLEITKLCAQAMGYEEYPPKAHWTKDDRRYFNISVNDFPLVWNPLHDDAQAMALVKKKKLELRCVIEYWHAWDECGEVGATLSKDLNRAICECCAKMMLAKKGASDDASAQDKDR